MKKKLYHQFACSSLMLPEHRARLARHRREQAGELCREGAVSTDEQQLEQFQRLLERALHLGLVLRATFVEKGRRRTVSGIPGRQPDPDSLRLQHEEGVLSIPIAAILHLEEDPSPRRK